LTVSTYGSFDVDNSNAQTNMNISTNDMVDATTAAAPPTSSITVPEPASLLLGGACIVAVVGVRRRMRLQK
jgi:beta-lactamase regulating signal transducer with metallopeptidase domain